MLPLVFLPTNFHAVGLCDCSIIGRLSYHFFHASFLHWLLNVWCFLACVFLANASFSKLCIAYLIACTAPASSVPTVGLSGVCFALLGLLMWQYPNKRRYNIIIGISILLTVLLCPHTVNNALHVWCYLLGIAYPCFPRLIRLNRLTRLIRFNRFNRLNRLNRLNRKKNNG